MKPERWTALLALALWACDDASSSRGAEAGDTGASDAATAPDIPRLPDPDGAIDATPGGDAAAPDPDARSPAPDAVASPDATPDAAWIEVDLDPRRALYTLDEVIEARARAYDLRGEPIGEVKFSWSVEPPGLAEVDPEGVVRTRGEGQGFVIACAAVGSCGRAAFFVDAGPPVLVVDEPARGAVLGGENSATLRVRGTAGDSGGQVTVRVNGLPVDLDPEGRFALDLEADFGLNRVEVTADDGVRRPAVRELREVLWAPTYLPVDRDGATVPGAMEIRIDQGLLDGDTPVDLPAGAGAVVLDELAQIVGALLRLADPSALLGDLQFGDGRTMALSATGARLGAPDIDLYLVGDGLELFIRMPDAALDTTGHVLLENERIALDGTLHASLAAFARLRLTFDGSLQAEVGDVAVAVEGIAGDFADPAADALINTFGSRLRTAAEQLVGTSVEGLLGEGLPDLVEEGLGSLFDSLGDIPVRLDPNIDGFVPLTLNLSLTPAGLTLRRRHSMTLVLDARVAQPVPVDAPHPDPGVAVPHEAPLHRGPGSGLVGGVRLAMMNAVLHEVWRAGLLRLAPPLPPELAGVLGQVTLDGVLPPVLAPAARGSGHLLQLQIGELRLEARQMGAEAADVFVIGIRAGVFVRVVDGRFTLAVAEDPDIRAELIAQADDRPVLSPNGLATLLEAVIWPQLQEALAGGLALGLDPVRIDPESLQRVAPRLRGLTLTPRFVQDPAQEGGRILLEGGLDARMELGD